MHAQNCWGPGHSNSKNFFQLVTKIWINGLVEYTHISKSE